MRRKLLFIERMLHGDGNYAFNALLPIRVRGTFKEIEIRQALEGLQKSHALLNATVKDDEQGYPWFVVDEANPVKIPIRTFMRNDEDDWQTESVKEWSKAFDSYKAPLMRLVWIKGELISELIFVMHHCLFDGRSALMILEEFLQLLDDPDVAIIPELPISNISDVVPQSMLNNRFYNIVAKLAIGAASLTLSLIPSKNRPEVRKNDYLIHWRFDKETTTAFLARCKNENVRAHSVICAIILDAFKQVQRKKAKNKILCPVDIRSFNPQIKKNNIFAFALMILVSAYPESDFFSNAKAIQKDIDKRMAKLNPYKIIMLFEAAHESLHKIVDFLRHQKPGNDCMFSNLGKIDIPHQYQSFELENIFSPSVMVPEGHATAFTTSTHMGEIDFSFISNENSLSFEDAKAIKDKMINTITTLAATKELSIA
jgi:NRPS condensation-like uncharacterized protein